MTVYSVTSTAAVYCGIALSNSKLAIANVPQGALSASVFYEEKPLGYRLPRQT
jgi:hypothetical protein